MSHVIPRGLPSPESSRQLVTTVLVHGPIPRTALARRLDLSPPSLTRLTKPLVAAGLLHEWPDVDGSRGRPSMVLDVRPTDQRFLGVKITADAATAVVTDLRANALEHAAVELAGHDVGTVVDTIERLYRDLDARHGISRLGIGLGGSVADGRIVTRTPFLGWRDVDLASAVEARLGIPAVVENDVVALANGEHWFGAGKGLSDFAVVTIGVGVGLCHVVADRVMDRYDVGVGTVGHVPLDPSGPRCPLGHAGCAAMLTIPSWIAQASVALGRSVTYPGFLELAREGHPAVVAILDTTARALGRLLSLATNLSTQDHVVLLGDGIDVYRLTEQTVHETMRAERDPEATPVTLLVDDGDFDVWARGAATVAIQAELRNAFAR